MIQKESRPYPKACTVAFGRVFYGAYARVYFGQVMIDDFEGVGKCYQRNDPTAEDSSDVLDTDGGEILIQDAGQIKYLHPFREGILVFCDNGVWYLAGSTDQGFSATSYTLVKVSPYVLYSNRSVVSVGEIVLFGSKESCYVIGDDTGSMVARSLTEMSIDSYWKTFIKSNTYAVYSDAKQQVFFVNTDGTMLMFDVKLKAWFPWKVTTGSRLLSGGFYDDVQGTVRLSTQLDGSVQYAQQGTALLDFGTGQYQSYILSQPETLGNYNKKKGTRLLKSLFKRTEKTITGYSTAQQSYLFDTPSSCMMSVRFDWDDGKVSTPREVYKPLPRGYLVQGLFPEAIRYKGEVVEYEDKVRGTGRAIQVRFESTGSKELPILGYSVRYSSE